MEASKSETKYERVRKIGVGSYGVVFKCINRHTGQVVAIKRYAENDSDPVIRKIAMREVRMLRQLRHPNLIHLIEVFRRKRRLHLVFDYCELTVLDVIEKYGADCPLNLIKKIVWQTVNGIRYCHERNCIHRDVKPENILINQMGVVKLCDFGFARNLNPFGRLAAIARDRRQLEGEEANKENRESGQPVAEATTTTTTATATPEEEEETADERQALTEYVATRWYRAPELLIGEVYYDIKIDIWAIGCVTAELMRGEPLWPGKTDLDQLCMIRSSLGELTASQTRTLLGQSVYSQVNMERLANLATNASLSLERKLPARVGQSGLDFVTACLRMDPARRPSSDQLLHHAYIQSARMAQFVRDASAGPGEATATASLAGEHQSARLVSRPLDASADLRAASRRSNSQSLMLLAGGQQLGRLQSTGEQAAHRLAPTDANPNRQKRKQLTSARAAANRLGAARKRTEPVQARDQQQVGANSERLARKLAPSGRPAGETPDTPVRLIRMERSAGLAGSRASSVSQLPALLADERRQPPAEQPVAVSRPQARQLNSRLAAASTLTPTNRQRRWH